MASPAQTAKWPGDAMVAYVVSLGQGLADRTQSDPLVQHKLQAIHALDHQIADLSQRATQHHAWNSSTTELLRLRHAMYEQKAQLSQQIRDAILGSRDVTDQIGPQRVTAQRKPPDTTPIAQYVDSWRQHIAPRLRGQLAVLCSHQTHGPGFDRSYYLDAQHEIH